MKNSAPQFGLFCFLAAPQAQFFYPGSIVALYSALAIFALAALSSATLKKIYVKYIALFLILFVFSFIVYKFGPRGEFEPRLSFVHNFALALALILTSRITDQEQGSKKILTLISVILFAEALIVIGQFTYLNWNLGVKPRTENFDATGVITGSYGNPNNVATILTLGVLTVIKSNSILKETHKYALSAFTGIAIFITLSRTALVLYLAGHAFFYIKSLFSHFSKERLLRTIAVISVISSSFYALYLTQGNVDNPVIERSMSRISSIFSTQGDESANFRAIAHIRLFENIAGLGFGTFSDLNYRTFFKEDDEELMKVNPHSVIVELSFLYGYLGLAIASIFFLSIFRDIYKSSGKTTSIFLISCIALLQAVPSTLLAIPSFFFFTIILATIGNSADRTRGRRTMRIDSAFVKTRCNREICDD